MTFGTGLKAGLAGGLVAAIVNVIIFYVGNVPQDVLTTMEQPIPVGLVGFASFFMVTLGGIAMYLLRDRGERVSQPGDRGYVAVAYLTVRPDH